MVSKTIEDLLRSHPDLADYGTAQSAETIRAAESTLGVAFPNSFKNYLAHWGQISFGPSEYFGLGSKVNGVVERTLDARETGRLPQTLIVVCDHEGDEYVCLNTALIENGECPVIIWDVPSRSISRSRAPTFDEYLITDMEAFLD
ncbi:MAG: SMI1/KNR4 family protein [Comamonadaceae bacterium]|nr:MAG: SMI1/KNR4 family protein [Comamonadaceae bacterium]